VWRAASEHDENGAGGWYAAAVATTCRWLATAPARVSGGTAGMLSSPATRRAGIPYEELIEAEYLEALILEQRRPRLAQSRPGWCDGVRDTLRWAWRREGPAPFDPAGQQSPG
jgi:hypothetical protein